MLPQFGLEPVGIRLLANAAIYVVAFFEEGGGGVVADSGGCAGDEDVFHGDF
jgi:hypothetical protein